MEQLFGGDYAVWLLLHELPNCGGCSGQDAVVE